MDALFLAPARAGLHADRRAAGDRARGDPRAASDASLPSGRKRNAYGGFAVPYCELALSAAPSSPAGLELTPIRGRPGEALGHPQPREGSRGGASRTGLDQASFQQVSQQCVEQKPFSITFNQTRAKLAQEYGGSRDRSAASRVHTSNRSVRVPRRQPVDRTSLPCTAAR